MIDYDFITGNSNNIGCGSFTLDFDFQQLYSITSYDVIKSLNFFQFFNKLILKAI